MSVLPNLGARLKDANVLLDCPGDSRPQVQYQALTHHFEEVKTGLALRVLEERAGPAAELQHFHVPVNNDPRRAVVSEQDALSLLLEVRQGGAAAVLGGSLEGRDLSTS